MLAARRLGNRRRFRQAGALTMAFLSFVQSVVRDRRGIATVEFALWSMLIFATLLLSADFAIYTLYKQRLERAVSEASLAAFVAKDDIDTDDIATYVTATAALPSQPSASVTCNGESSCVKTNRTYACLSGADDSYTPALSANAACSSGGLSGYYLTVSATYVFQHVVMPNPFLEGRPMTASATVRLE
jgi:Flp pilus assembly protein TadG